MIGEVLHGFRLTVKLGESSRGETYLACDQASGQKASVLVLRPELSSDAGLLAACFAQAMAASQTAHPGIAALYGSGVHAGGRAFLVMEHLAGRTLADALVSQGRVDDSESLADIGWQLASLLEAVHGAGIVHGRLQPDSIFLTFPPDRGGRPLVKVVDFGLAKLLLDAQLYMSPEATGGQGHIDHRADVYSLGCILFEMACGQPPSARENGNGLVAAPAGETPPSGVSFEPTVPPAIATLIDRMLRKRPDERPQSMAEVVSLLGRLRAVSAPIVVPTVVVSSSPDQGSSPRRQDPTALLPPTHPACPVRPTTWIGRVQEGTAVFVPPVRQRHRPLAQPAGRAPQRPAVSIPIAIVTAAAVLAAGAGVLFLRGRRPPASAQTSPPVGETLEPTSDEEAPSPTPLAEPTPARPSWPETEPGGPDNPTPDDSARLVPNRPRPEKRRQARRW